MKKIYFVFDQLPPLDAGGLISTYVRLNELLNHDYKIEIISVFNHHVNGRKTFEKEHILLSRKIDIRFFKKFKAIKKGRILDFSNGLFDAVYYFSSIPYARYKMKKLISNEDNVIVSSPSAAIFMHRNCKFILEIHSKFENFWRGGFKSKLQLSLMNRPKLVLFRTKADAEKGSKYYPSDYVYNFYDNSGIILKKNIHNKMKKAIYMGRLHSDKDPLRLIEICKKINEIDKEFVLDIYGHGDLKDEMITLIKEYNLEKNVYLRGYTNNKNIYQEYSMLWITSKTEGFPLTIIEAKANAVPTISTNWGEGISEAITQGEDGYYFDSDEEYVEIVIDLFYNVNKIVTMSNKALESYEKFSKNEAKDRWLQLLNTYKNG